ncbi:MAG: hypothetical protein NZ927_07480 [Candidatus Calescibacterium sp.]|nr:hypothetical protein [Candidatus Calescibacterium sp.]
MRYYYEVDQELGYDIVKNKKGYSHRVEGTKLSVWSNEIGCYDYPYRGEKDFMILVGDSFTWGFVPFEKTMGVVIENTIRKRLLKCGLPGSGTKQQMIKAKKVIEQVGSNPSIIIVGYFLRNDLIDDWLFPRITVVDGFSLIQIFLKDIRTGEKEVVSIDDLRKKLKELDSLEIKIKFWLIQNSVIYNILRNSIFLRKIAVSFGLADRRREEEVLPTYWFASYIPPDIYQSKYHWLNEAWSQHIKNILEFNDYAKQIGSKLLMVLIPVREQVYEPLWPDLEDIKPDVPNKILSDVFEKHGILYLDLTEEFKRYAKLQRKLSLGEQKGLYYRFDSHWNENGSYIAGLLVSKYIVEKGLVEVQDKEGVLQNIESELNRMKKVLAED